MSRDSEVGFLSLWLQRQWLARPVCFTEVRNMADLTLGLYVILCGGYLLVVSFSAH